MEDLHNIRLPAGWYPDPSGADHRRWWDGTTWTQHTAPFQRPVVVYEVDDFAENRAEAEGAQTAPAPRRIRTAARLGRSLAALAHKLPFGLPTADRADEPTDDGSADAAAKPPAGPRATAARPRSAAEKATPAEAAPKTAAPKKATAKKPTVKKPSPKKPAAEKAQTTGRHVR